MPELPEVEVVKLFLEPKLLHKTITKIEILSPKSFIGDPKKVINNKIIKFSRLGKQLSLHLSNHLILLFHLKMTGQLILVSPCLPASGGSREGLGVGLPDILIMSNLISQNTNRINSEFFKMFYLPLH